MQKAHNGRGERCGIRCSIQFIILPFILEEVIVAEQGVERQTFKE
jgi:hypothetical protein